MITRALKVSLLGIAMLIALAAPTTAADAEMTIPEARAATKAKVKSLYHPIVTTVAGCSWFDTNKFDCSGRFRTSKRRCTFASFVDNTGESVKVRIYGKRCKRL